MMFCPQGLILRDAALHCRRRGLPFRVIGQGSNVLAADDGYPGILLRACGRLQVRKESKGLLTVAACSRLDDLARVCAAQGWGGWSFASGLPGTLGGALAGNAGAFGSSVGDRITRVLVLDAVGAVRWIPAAEMDFAYRHSRLESGNEIALAAVVRITSGLPARLQAERRALLARRAAMHPDWRRWPNAGSVFRNPPGGRAAGCLLEQAGVHGWHAGGARVWERHANFIVHDGREVSALQVWTLMQRMAAAVRRRSGIRLEPEVRLLGFFPPLHSPAGAEAPR